MPIRKPRAGFRFDSKVGRYRSQRTGRLVGAAEIRRGVDVIVTKSARRVDALGAQLRSGQIGVEEWEIAMRAELKTTHLNATMAAKGGRAQITQADYGRAGQRLRQEYQYLSRFADQVHSGQIPLDGRFQRRAASYSLAARGTFSETERAEQAERGFTLERNIIRPGENCEGCIAATALGRVPVGTLPAIGSRDCLTHCRCAIVYSRSA